MRKRIANRFPIDSVWPAINADQAVKICFRQTIAEPDQPLICRNLVGANDREALNGLAVGEISIAEPATFQCIKIIEIDQQNVVERGLDGWEKAGASGVKLLVAQSSACLQQSPVRPSIVSGHPAEMGHEIHRSALDAWALPLPNLLYQLPRQRCST